MSTTLFFLGTTYYSLLLPVNPFNVLQQQIYNTDNWEGDELESYPLLLQFIVMGIVCYCKINNNVFISLFFMLSYTMLYLIDPIFDLDEDNYHSYLFFTNINKTNQFLQMLLFTFVYTIAIYQRTNVEQMTDNDDNIHNKNLLKTHHPTSNKYETTNSNKIMESRKLAMEQQQERINKRVEQLRLRNIKRQL